MVVDQAMAFMHILVKSMNALKIHLCTITKHNYKDVGVERYRRSLNHAWTIVSAARETMKYFVEASMLAAYAWNAMPIDGTDIRRSIPAIGRSLKFPMDITIVELPSPIDDATNATVRYICSICSDSRFVKYLVTWLTDQPNSHHYSIQYWRYGHC